MKKMRAGPWPKDVNIPRACVYETSPFIKVERGFSAERKT